MHWRQTQSRGMGDQSDGHSPNSITCCWNSALKNHEFYTKLVPNLLCIVSGYYKEERKCMDRKGRISLVFNQSPPPHPKPNSRTTPDQSHQFLALKSAICCLQSEGQPFWVLSTYGSCFAYADKVSHSSFIYFIKLSNVLTVVYCVLLSIPCGWLYSFLVWKWFVLSNNQYFQLSFTYCRHLLTSW